MPDPGNPKERGAALLTVLLLVAVMAVVASTALERVALATRMTGNGGAVDQARAFADAGTEMARLRINDLVESNPAKITLAGGWMGTPQTIPVPGGLATAQVTDGGNCFNLNGLVSEASPGTYVTYPSARIEFARLMRLIQIPAQAADHIAAATADAINAARARSERIIAIGTTTLRLLEAAAAEDGTVRPFCGKTDIFITPGCRFKVVDALLTNFHLPCSTLFMLVSAFSGLDTMKAAYGHAITTGYRFYSYGDACWLERTDAP